MPSPREAAPAASLPRSFSPSASASLPAEQGEEDSITMHLRSNPHDIGNFFTVARDAGLALTARGNCSTAGTAQHGTAHFKRKAGAAP